MRKLIDAQRVYSKDYLVDINFQLAAAKRLLEEENKNDLLRAFLWDESEEGYEFWEDAFHNGLRDGHRIILQDMVDSLS